MLTVFARSDDCPPYWKHIPKIRIHIPITLDPLIFKYLHNYIVSNSLISPVQSGFTTNDSAVFQLIDLYDTFSKAIDDCKEIRVIFCDISKAFDRVWHRGLLFKLRRMGITGPLLN